jgi:hypothetical protein
LLIAENYAKDKEVLQEAVKQQILKTKPKKEESQKSPGAFYKKRR